MIRLCIEPGCGNEVAKRARCLEHHRQRERERSARRRGRKVYDSKRWAILRRRKLALDSLCEPCGELAVDVHHRHGVETDPWSLAGLESLCRSCHAKHHAQEWTKG